MTLVIEIPQARSFDLQFREDLTSEEFWELCSRNPELVVEREADGKISVMTPVSFLTGKKENRLNAYLTIWAIDNGMGETGSSSTGFTLPNGAVKSPDASWVSDERMEGATLVELARFPPLVPDFVAEIRSKSDDLKPLQKKMSEDWMEQGVRLGWLIDPKAEKVHIYREDGSIEIVKSFDGVLSGEDVMPGFTFDLNKLSMTKK